MSCYSFRINDRAARAFGHQLAVIGDQLDREWTSRKPNWLPTPFHMLRPAHALTRTIYRYKIRKKKPSIISTAYVTDCEDIVTLCFCSFLGIFTVSYGASRACLQQ